MKTTRIKCFVLPDLDPIRDQNFGEVITEEHISRFPAFPTPEAMSAEAFELLDFLMENIGKRIVFVEESGPGNAMSLHEAIEKVLHKTQINPR